MFLLQFPFPRRSQCCKPDISFSNCLHMLLLKEFQSPLLESRVVQRNLETLPLSSAGFLAWSAAAKWHNVISSFWHDTLGAEESQSMFSRRDAYFSLAVFHKSLLAVAENAPAWICEHHDTPARWDWHWLFQCSYLFCPACCRTPVELAGFNRDTIISQIQYTSHPCPYPKEW